MLVRLLILLGMFSELLVATPIANLEAIDQNGKPFSAHSLKGSYILISFVFSSCPMPKMCPLTVRLNKKVQDLWKKEIKAPLTLLIVTLDPEGDTPEVLKKYGLRFSLNEKSTFLVTGDPQKLSDFGSTFNVAGWPSGNTTVHNLKTILVGPTLEELKQYKENEWTPEQLIQDAKTFLRQ
ncbi:MAG: SCO family protein [Pseudomonadota bacterium]